MPYGITWLEMQANWILPLPECHTAIHTSFARAF
jgi:hypothetical protein